jgi:sigma-E factor negative regulatory protein RseC
MTSSDRFGNIEHAGVVQKSDANSVIVRILSETACAGCHAEGSCSLSGVKEKMVEVNGNYNVSPGDNVTVLMKKSMGFTALFLGYVLPLIIFILILIILISLPLSELAAGLGSIGFLGIYYLLLYFFREKIRNKFIFTIKTL